MNAPTPTDQALAHHMAAIVGFFDQLAKSPPTDQAHEQQLFTDVFLPAFAAYCEHGSPAVALDIEQLVYLNYVKRWEAESHFRVTYDALVPLLRRVAERAAPDLARVHQRQVAAPARKEGDPPLVFFVIHVESGLAHIQSLLRYLESMREFGADLLPLQPVVVTLDGADPGLRQRLKALQVPLVALGDLEPRRANAYIKLIKFAALCHDHQPQAIVFVSLVMWMASFFAARLAQTQVWWAMKYHAFSSPDIDGYMCGSPDGQPRTLGGNQWETSPFGGSDWFAPELRAEAAAVKQRLGPWKTVFGSIGREEKLRDPAFLDAVCGVLEANPESVFLWTGSRQDGVIQSFFEGRGLEERTRFIGWVNTRLYAQVIDVYLDSFPFPGGYTVYEAMAARRPVVMMKLAYPSVGLQNNASPYYFAADTADGVSADVQALFRKADGPLYYPVAESRDDYISYASRFARDPALHAEVGRINAEFVERFMSNRQGMADGYHRALHKFIRQTQ